MEQVNILYSVILGGTATTVLTELLKLPFVAVPAQKYPRTTAAILSALSAVVAFLIQGIAFTGNATQLAVTGVGAFLVSAFTYNQALRGLNTNTENQHQNLNASQESGGSAVFPGTKN